MTRAALYIRVSTEEQAQHGYSLEAQREALTVYANKNNLAIVDYYVDDGYSARKKYTTRKEFMRMLRDVEANKIDIILFIKLDRWFRSVKDYYKIQEILEAHNVGWKTTEEHYDTTTTNGRLYINIRLSVAQDESDRTSDRIKFVFENKVARGEVISGSVPLGYKIEDKCLVHDDTKKDVIVEIFNKYAECQNKYATHKYVNDKFEYKINRKTFDRILSNPIYTGAHLGNNEFCEPIISLELFETVQNIQQKRNIKKTSTGRVYVFSGLVRCAECGHSCAGQYARGHMYYRCINAIVERRCHNRMSINEKQIEEWLLSNIAEKLNERLREYETAKKSKKKSSVNKSQIKRKMERLKELFVNEFISMEEYKRDYAVYSSQLESERSVETIPLDMSVISKYFNDDFADTYNRLDKKERQTFWRHIVRELSVDSEKNIDVYLL
jgi:DNA invertase Pin-like site-specific DNA recombinase